MVSFCHSSRFKHVFKETDFSLTPRPISVPKKKKNFDMRLKGAFFFFSVIAVAVASQGLCAEGEVIVCLIRWGQLLFYIYNTEALYILSARSAIFNF